MRPALSEGSPVPRRTTGALPTRRHLPGDGAPPGDLDPAAGFDYACDLFDARFFWEAHEVWEHEWRALPRGSPRAELLRGLICAAACALKHHQGHVDGARRLRERAAAGFLGAGSETGGLELPELLARLDAFLEGGPWPTLPTR